MRGKKWQKSISSEKKMKLDYQKINKSLMTFRNVLYGIFQNSSHHHKNDDMKQNKNTFIHIFVSRKKKIIEKNL